MKRSSVLKLRGEQWVKVWEADELELCVVPSAGTTMPGLRRSMLSEVDKLQICQSVFVNFRGYTDDDGKPVENTITARLELIDVSACFYSIQTRVVEVQNELAEGEADAGSD